jgi:hypothetical protein
MNDMDQRYELQGKKRFLNIIDYKSGNLFPSAKTKGNKHILFIAVRFSER